MLLWSTLFAIYLCRVLLNLSVLAFTLHYFTYLSYFTHFWFVYIAQDIRK